MKNISIIIKQDYLNFKLRQMFRDKVCGFVSFPLVLDKERGMLKKYLLALSKKLSKTL